MAQPPTPPFTPSPPGDSRPGMQGPPQQDSGVNYVNTDTGLGGVLIEPEDVNNSQAGIYSYSTGNPDRARDPGTPAPLTLRGGNVNVDHTVKDLSKSTKKTLADYMGKKTSVNSYPVDGIPASVETKIAGDSNITPKIPDPGATNSAYHTRTGGSVLGVNLQPVNSPLKGWNVIPTSPDSPDSLVKETVTKGKSQPESPEALTGNDLLKDEPSPSLTRYQSAVLSSNRFSSISGREKTFMSDARRAKLSRVDQSGVSFVTIEEGEESGRFNPTLHHPRFGEVTVGRLANVSKDMSIRATPPAGKKVSIKDFSVDLAIANVSELEPADEDYVSITGGLSFGNVNNPFKHFSSAATIATAAATTNVVTNVITNLYDILLLILDKSSLSANETFVKQMGVSSRYSTVLNILRIPPTTFTVSEAVARGVNYFLGRDDNFAVISALAVDTLVGLSQVATLSKMIVMSGAEVMRKISEIFKANISSLRSALLETLSLMKELSDSKLMAALRMIIQQGDALLKADQHILSDSINDFASAGLPRVHMARVVDKSGEVTSVLPYSSGRAPAALLMPKDISQFTQDASAYLETPLVGASDQHIRARYISTNRISHGSDATPKTLDEYTVEYVEGRLDAEYVPFYFHDIRTNEIVSFHAFLESLSDSFSASYESIEGIGRIEPVKMYKGTQRKIDITFIVISTNENDFGFMWEKINKMTTLVYPQYTQGRRHNVGENYSFIQPFSQLVGATPLVRIRLGDLIRSNYSKFALARLFGAELPDTRFNKPLPSTTDVTAPQVEIVKDAENKPAAITTPQKETAEERKERQEKESADKLFKTRFQKILKDKAETTFMLKANSRIIRTEDSGGDGDVKIALRKLSGRPKTRSFEFEVPVKRLERYTWDQFLEDTPAVYAAGTEYMETETYEVFEAVEVAEAAEQSRPEFKVLKNQEVGRRPVYDENGQQKLITIYNEGSEFARKSPGGDIVYDEENKRYIRKNVPLTETLWGDRTWKKDGVFWEEVLESSEENRAADSSELPSSLSGPTATLSTLVATGRTATRQVKKRSKPHKLPFVVWKVSIPWNLHGSSWRLQGASDDAVVYRDKVELLKKGAEVDIRADAAESVFYVLESDLLPTLKMKKKILQTGFTKKYQESVVPPAPEPAAAAAPAPDTAPAPATTEPTTSVQTLSQIEELSRFLDEDKNALVKSFKSASGKGLAGVIESMSFDWMTYQWEVNPGKTAPKACKITISFSPIHDISPGIDSQGYNRAHIYPVFDKSVPGIGASAEPKRGE